MDMWLSICMVMDVYLVLMCMNPVGLRTADVNTLGTGSQLNDVYYYLLSDIVLCKVDAGKLCHSIFSEVLWRCREAPVFKSSKS